MSLPLFRIILASYAVLWERRALALRQLLIPCVVLTVLASTFEQRSPGANKLLDSLGSLIVCMAIAVILRSAQRLVLLGSGGRKADDRDGFLRANIRYFGWLLGIICLCSFAMLLGILAFYFVAGPISSSALLMPLWLASFYIASRIALVLPACAMNLDCALETAWRLGTGNALRLFALTGIGFIVVPLMLMLLIRQLGVENTYVFNFLGAVLLCPAGAALALSWHELNTGSLESGESK